MLRVIYLSEEDATRVAILLRLQGGPKGIRLADKIMASDPFDPEHSVVDIKQKD